MGATFRESVARRRRDRAKARGVAWPAGRLPEDELQGGQRALAVPPGGRSIAIHWIRVSGDTTSWARSARNAVNYSWGGSPALHRGISRAAWANHCRPDVASGSSVQNRIIAIPDSGPIDRSGIADTATRESHRVRCAIHSPFRKVWRSTLAAVQKEELRTSGLPHLRNFRRYPPWFTQKGSAFKIRKALSTLPAWRPVSLKWAGFSCAAWSGRWIPMLDRDAQLVRGIVPSQMQIRFQDLLTRSW